VVEPGHHETAPTHPLRYVLITTARNEERFIRQTLASVVSQTVLPERYVVVDDGSTDKTPSIVAEFAEGRPWLTLLQQPPRVGRDFAGKVRAFNAGLEQVEHLRCDIIGNLDADVSVEADLCEYLLAQFASDPTLGVAGTVYTQPGFDSMLDSFEGEDSVAGPLQFFRRECFEEIGGYVPNRLGGIDWIAVTTARMNGWRTRTFTGKRFHHHRSMGTATRSPVGAMFDYGRKDYFLGGSPVWQCARACYRMTKQPRILGGLALLAGYSWAALRRTPRPVDSRLVKFHRGEQRRKLRKIFVSLLTFRRLDKFHSAKLRTP